MNKKFILMLIFILAIGSFAGCKPAAEKPLEDPNTRDPYDNYNPNKDNVNNKANSSVDERSIESNINQITGVDHCVVVLNENTAYCGVVTNGITNSEVNNIRKKVTDKIKATNANINTVYVTTDQLSIDNMIKLKREANMTKTRTNKMVEEIKGYFR